jgi:hypothetical protein
VDHDRVRYLFEQINRTLFLLRSEEDEKLRQDILDGLLEDKESPIKELEELYGVDI